ncbi:hypothetical protein scyTo_0000172 [Scyliorhinus torazame]|uniref:Uncharacterized protein n=1 Tax=Scyliorhinus torazame TaxID=75743 RepID=A0A401NRR7_SCYTO|nr:hypothetical protein [Scyliorhinus torazame]
MSSQEDSSVETCTSNPEGKPEQVPRHDALKMQMMPSWGEIFEERNKILGYLKKLSNSLAKLHSVPCDCAPFNWK